MVDSFSSDSKIPMPGISKQKLKFTGKGKPDTNFFLEILQLLQEVNITTFCIAFLLFFMTTLIHHQWL